MREECANTISHLASLLSWNHYMALFRRIFNNVSVWGVREGQIHSSEVNPSKRQDRAITKEMETYNKLYTRMLCLVVEAFHFDLKEVDFMDVVNEKMALLAEDAMSAKALKQVEFMKRKGVESVEGVKGVEDVKMEEEKGGVEMEEVKEEDKEDEEEKDEEEMEDEMEVEQPWLVKEPRELTLTDKKKILRLVLTVVIPDLRK